MQAQTDPQASLFLSSSRFTCAGSMCDGSSTGISTVSKPHFLKVGNSFVLAFVKGDVNKNVLMPSLIKFRFVCARGYEMRVSCQCSSRVHERQADSNRMVAREGAKGAK